MFLELFLFAKKHEILEGRDSLYFQVFPWHFHFMRGHSLVERTEHSSSSAADIIVHIMYVYVLLHSYYIICTDNKWTPPRNSGGIP